MAEILFSVKNLVKVFPNGNRGLSGITLDVYSGECVVIAGSNGSGKTLLALILLGLSDPTEGEVRFRDLLSQDAGEALRQQAGLVFQNADAQIIGETVAEDAGFGPKNRGFPPEEVKRRVRAALEAVGLADKEEYPPRRLSGGEKRRLAVAGVLAMGCETLILDEPFANLDWQGVVRLLRVIRDLKQAGKTLIILTHELEKVLAFADRLIILHQGRIREDGPPAAVLDRLKDEYGVRDPRSSYTRVEDCTWLD
ncbi:MAG: energy-coupling factor ABC transporter ATP-binding protein [Spirochaetaceae bacterium]|jgi:biotin transport system ATP-binding protein|nr:energy-coupling factor ABC transporter ATP-binding protein [Spirochaetaceae bacterium]